MEKQHMIKPRLNILSEDQIQYIHMEALKILSTVGVRVQSKAGLNMFKKAIGAKGVCDDRVCIPAELVENAVKTAPKSVRIYDRTGAHSFAMPDETRFGIGVTTLYYQDPADQKLHLFSGPHLETTVRMADRLPAFDFVSTPGILHDVPAERLDLQTTLLMTANTDKALVLLVSNENSMAPVLDLLEHLHGDIQSKPSFIPFVTPITPLLIDPGTVTKMQAALDRKLPFIYLNFGMTGASTPIQPVGTLALMVAELLAGITLSQLMQAGAPIILGALPAYMDMKGMGNFYDMNSYLVNLAIAEMMSFYGLPHFGTSGNTMGWGSDIVSAGHLWLNQITSCIGKVGMAAFVGCILGAKVFSPRNIVYANEVIAQARRFARGFEWNPDTSLVPEIEQVGPGGSFLTSDATLEHCRDAYFRSDIFPLLTLEEWNNRDCPRAEDLLRDHTLEIINGFAPGDAYAQMMEKGKAFIQMQLKKA